MRLVAILSPFAGQQRKNIEYARRAMLDSLKRGEAPYASHLLYPQVLNDLRTKDREMGMEVGRAWMERADAAIVYADLGLSEGMLRDLEGARLAGLEVEVRMIGKAKRKRTKKPDEAKEATPSKKPAGDGAPGKRRTRHLMSGDALKAIQSANAGLTRTRLRNLLNCSGATLTRVIDDLLKTGSVELEGKGRKAKYRAKTKAADSGVQGAIDEVVGS